MKKKITPVAIYLSEEIALELTREYNKAVLANRLPSGANWQDFLRNIITDFLATRKGE